MHHVVAEKLVEIHTSYFKIPTNRAKSFVVNLLTRKWGHSIARGWARLLLERLRENVDLPADLMHLPPKPNPRWNRRLPISTRPEFFKQAVEETPTQSVPPRTRWST